MTVETFDKFKALGLSENTLKALKKKGFEEPTEIQEKTIPLLLAGEKDVVGQAQTGTGKTAAFGLPLIEKLEERTKHIQALILTPTRELAIQVSEEINSLKGHKRLNMYPIYGGQSIDLQLKRLSMGIDIVVGTPGRVLDHLRRGSMKLGKISHLVLDEADEMLNMGFIDDIEEILKNTNKEKKVLLFSATMPREILEIAKRYMRDYEFVRVKKEQLTVSLTDQIYFEVRESDKLEALSRIIDIEQNFYGLIFCRTKVDVDRVSNKLTDRGYDADALHGDISQHQRERILNKFKQKRTNVLVATDVAARGIDIDSLTHVINYSLPQDPESYVHRIGRTGRAGKEGTAITFVTPEEYRRLSVIKRVAKTDIRRENLPQITDVIEAKKLKIKEEILNVLKTDNFDTYTKLAQELLSDNEAGKVLSALLKYSFQDDLDESSYSQIQNISVNKTGKTQLFVALGKVDEMTPKKLVDYITQETEVSPQKIRNVNVLEKFSFITVPFEEAELILTIFKKKRRGKRPIVDRAKEKTSSPKRNEGHPPHRKDAPRQKKYR